MKNNFAVLYIFWSSFLGKPLLSLWLLLSPLILIVESNVIPYYFKIIIDSMSDTTNVRELIFHNITKSLILLAISWIVYVLIIRLSHHANSRYEPWLESEIRILIFERICKLKPIELEHTNTGTLISKISSLATAITDIRSIVCWSLIPTLGVVLVAICMMYQVNIIYSYIIGIWFVVQIAIATSLANFVNTKSDRNAKDKNDLFGMVSNSLDNLLLTRILNNFINEIRYLRKIQEKEKKSNVDLLYSMNIYQLMIDIPSIIMFGAIFYNIILDWQFPSITTGDAVFIFNSTYAIMFQVYCLSSSISRLFRSIGIATQSLNDLSIRNNKNVRVDYKFLTPDLKLSDINFSYTLGMPTIANLSLTISSGKKVGLVGGSGSGKSTLIKIIAQIYEDYEGKVFVDNKDLCHISFGSLYNFVAPVPQNNTLFNRSIRENILYGNQDITEEEFLVAIQKSCCHNFIKNLHLGYDTIINENATNISEGQKQRIALARVFFDKYKLILLDESTSAIDQPTEQIIINNLLLENKTLILATHRLSTLKDFDLIYVLHEGKLEECGNFESLVNKKGTFYKLLNESQR